MAARTHELFAALASPHRLTIVTWLASRGHASLGEIHQLPPLAAFRQPTVTEHLKLLGAQGLAVKSLGHRGQWSVAMPNSLGELVALAEFVERTFLHASSLPDHEAMVRHMRKTDMARLSGQAMP